MDIIDVLGKPCPIPVIEAKKALRRAAAGEAVRILVDNDISRQNLEKMARGMGCASSFEARGDGSILVSIIAAGPVEGGAGQGLPSLEADIVGRSVIRGYGDEGLVIAFSKNTMGSGSDELGAVLVKAFIYSLTELDSPPETLLFFNSGIRLTTEGSASLADLKALESGGTIISSCGTCLDFYGVKDKLAVGNVTNMYAIASAMGSAGKLINI